MGHSAGSVAILSILRKPGLCSFKYAEHCDTHQNSQGSTNFNNDFQQQFATYFQHISDLFPTYFEHISTANKPPMALIDFGAMQVIYGGRAWCALRGRKSRSNVGSVALTSRRTCPERRAVQDGRWRPYGKQPQNYGRMNPGSTTFNGKTALFRLGHF